MASATKHNLDSNAGAAPRSWGAWLIVGLVLAMAGALIFYFWYQPARWRSGARRAIAVGEYDAAQQLLDRAVRRRPADTESRLQLAQLLDRAGHPDEAAEQLSRLPGEVLDQEDILTNLGRVLISAARPSEAELHLRRCIDQYPRTIRARQLLLDIYRWQHREDEGLALRSELSKLARGMSLGDRLWIMLRSFIEEYTKVEDQENWEQLVRCWERDRDDVLVRIAMARHLILVGDRVQEAAADLESLLPRAPQSVAAIASLLEYYLNIEGTSLDRAEQLIKVWPKPYRSSPFWRFQGQILERHGEEDAAIDAYRQALTLRPDHVPSLQSLSTLLTRTGKVRGDENMLRQGTQLANSMTEVSKTQSEAQPLLGRLLKWLEDWNQNPQGTRGQPDTEVVQEVADFYDRLGRGRESQEWRDVLAKLAPAP